MNRAVSPPTGTVVHVPFPLNAVYAPVPPVIRQRPVPLSACSAGNAVTRNVIVPLPSSHVLTRSAFSP